MDTGARVAAPGYSGADSFSYTTADPSSATDSGTVTISVVEMDTVAPTVTSVSPVDGAIGIDTITPIVITFSEAMNTAAFTISSSPCVDTCPTYDVAWSAGDTVLTLTKSNGNFDTNTEYEIEISDTEDAAGNSGALFSFSFTTYIPMVLTEVTPIPAKINSRNPVYYFSTNEDDADYGEKQYLSESCSLDGNDNAEVHIDPVAHTFTIVGAKPGNQYECSFLLQTTLRGNSNMLHVGPLLVTMPLNVTSGYRPKSNSESSNNQVVINQKLTQLPKQQNKPSTLNDSDVKKIYKLGSFGDFVKMIQEELNKQEGIATLVADGRFGIKTFNAVKIFQAQHGLDADGLVGLKTLTALGLVK